MSRFTPYLMLGGALVLAVAAWWSVIRQVDRGPRTFSAPRNEAAPETSPPPSTTVETARLRGDVLAGVVHETLQALIAKADDRGTRQRSVSRMTRVLEKEGRGTPESRERAAKLVLDLIGQRIEDTNRTGWPMKEFDPRAIEALALELANGMRRRLPTDGTESKHTGKLLAKVRAKPPPGHEGVSWATLGGYEYEEGMTLPAPVLALHDNPVAVAGYMISLGETDDVTEFLLVESLWDCCFGVPPDLHQGIHVTVPEGKSVAFTVGPIQVVGQLDVGEELEDGEVIGLYRMHTADVRPVTPTGH